MSGPAEDLWARSKILLAESDFEAAIALLRRCLHEKPYFPDAARALAEALAQHSVGLIHCGRMDEAEAGLHEAHRLAPTRPDFGAAAAVLSYNRGVAAAQAADLAQAEQAIRSALACNPDLPQARESLANVLVVAAPNSGKPLTILREALLYDPRNARAAEALRSRLRALSAAHLAGGRVVEAECTARAALALGPECPECQASLAGVLEDSARRLASQGKVGAALAALREHMTLLPLRPTGKDMFVELTIAAARTSRDAGCHDRAVSQLYTLLAGNGKLDARATTELLHQLKCRVESELRAGDIDAAILSAWEAVSIHKSPEQSDMLAAILRNKAANLFNAGDALTAEASIRSALRLSRTPGELRNDLAAVLFSAALTNPAGYERDFLTSKLLEAAADTTPRSSVIAKELAVWGENGPASYVLHQIKHDIAGASPTTLAVIDGLGEVCLKKFNVNGTHEVFSRMMPLTGRADICETVIADHALRIGLPADALAILERGTGSWSRRFSVATIAQFRDSGLADDIQPAARQVSSAQANDRLALSTITNYGRFAHVVIDYVIAKLYAARHGLVLETPDWCGHYLFEVDDPLYAHDLPRRKLGLTKNRDLIASNDVRVSGIDMFGFGGDCFRLQFRAQIRSLLKIRPRWLPMLTPGLNALRRRGDTVIAVHLRRGDRVVLGDVAPEDIYLDWLAANFDRFDRPVVFIASDDEDVFSKFARYDPVTLKDVATPWGHNAFLQDFFVLMHADVLMVSTGVFAVLAAALNDVAHTFLRPNGDKTRLETYEPWRPD